MATNDHDLDELLQRMKAFAASRQFPDANSRRERLSRLAAAIESREDALLDALKADLGRCPTEAYTSEIGFVLRDIRYARKHVRRWMKPRRVRPPLMTQPARAFVQPEPLGVALIVGPWNYPLQLLLSPAAAALTAGNAVCLKASEFAPATADVVHDLLSATFSDEEICVVRGDHEVSSRLTSLPFDHILFTGSTQTGRKVAAAAAANLVPVTLELGGKSPCVVCADASLKPSARRIMWGKLLNAGQTCVAPDYVLVHDSIMEQFLDSLRATVREFLPHTAQQPNADYGRIINRKHYDRLVRLMEGTNVFEGGECDAERLTITPTILTDVDENHPVMREEIFGPLLPVIPIRSLDDAIERINGRPKPLSAYIFTNDRAAMKIFRARVSAGGICINDTIVHLTPADLPFGGVGASGYGRYRGRAGFDTFSNLKAVMRRGFWFDLPFRFPPYKTPLSTLKRAYRWLSG